MKTILIILGVLVIIYFIQKYRLAAYVKTLPAGSVVKPSLNYFPADLSARKTYEYEL